MSAAADLPLCPIPAANVSSVPQRSPLRYPGGKTWLIPHIRRWLTEARPQRLVEPFAGGASATLCAVAEGLVVQGLTAEIDPDVAAFWRAALHHGPELRARVRALDPTLENLREIAAAQPKDDVGRGFRTLVLNRTRRGGVLAPGATFMRQGEGGRGVASRWYPDTLEKRLAAVASLAPKISFREMDGLALLEAAPEAAAFVDPPYVGGGGKQAGRRLYARHEVSMAVLFAALAARSSAFLMTLDAADEVLRLVAAHGFHAERIQMRGAHNAPRRELLISRAPIQWEA